MKRTFFIVLAAVVVLVGMFIWLRNRRTDGTVSVQTGSLLIAKISTVRKSGGRVDWSAPNKPVAFDKEVGKNHYEVFTMNPDGSAEQCVTCNNISLAHLSNGNPAWNPNGKWIAFQMVKATAATGASNTPGIGVQSELWIITPDGTKAVKLVSTDNSPDVGILHPHFSPDGTKLAWSQMYQRSNIFGKNQEYGYWQLKVADFVDGTTPYVTNIKSYAPGGSAFYENHGLSPDNQWLYFTSNMRAKQQHKGLYADNDIYRLNLNTDSLEQLTTIGYNEHAEISPDGTTIVWMSSRDIKGGGTDYWLMNTDGSNKRRLTYFNTPGHSEYSGARVVAADSAWSPDGSKIMVYLQTNLFTQVGMIDLITLSSHY